MKLTKNISVKNLLIRSVLISFLLFVGIMSTISIYILFQNKKNDEQKYAEIIFKRQAEKISSQLGKAILINQLISENNNFFSSDLSALKEFFTEILQSRKEISGLYFYKGNLKSFIDRNEIELTDTSNNSISLTVNKTGNKLFYSSFITANFESVLNNIDKIFNSEGIIISEPFKIKQNKKSEDAINISNPIRLNDKIIGFISINYKLNELIQFVKNDKFSESDFILLSPAKNIIASTINQQNIGMNILTLSGKENLIFENGFSNQSHPFRNVSKISTANSNAVFELYSICTFFADKKYESHLLLFIILLFVSVLSETVLLYFFIRKSFLPLKKITQISEKLSLGNFEIVETDDLNNDYKRIAENLTGVIQKNSEIINFADHIFSDNYDFRIKKLSDEDKVSYALNRISSHLKIKQEKRLSEEKETQKQLWMRKGRFEISEAERRSSKDISELSYNIIRSLVKYTDALMGGMYLYDKENKSIELKAAYAYEKQKHFSANFKPGESIVGACILEKRKIILDNIPDDYIKIATGLGSGTPSVIAVIPVFFKNEINAVIEIAFIKTPEEYVIQFVEQLGDSIGAWIDASLISTKTAELLSVSQEQTQKLAEKEEELNKKVLELQEIQEKTNLINARYKSMLNAVNQTIMTVEYTLDGTIINCNQVYTEIMGFMPEDIEGKNVLDIVKDQSEGLTEIMEEVKKGKSIKKEVKRYTKSGEEKWLTATYTPYYNEEGKISQILFFAVDISKINNK